MPNSYPFKEGDTYYTLDEDGDWVESCWDFVSEEIHDQNLHKVYYREKDIKTKIKMPKYKIKETYTIETDANPETIKGKIITGDVPHEDYQDFHCEVTPLKERFIFHSFDVNDGEHTYTINHVESLETCMAIANRTNTDYSNDDELLEDSHMHLLYHGFDDMDDVDDGCMWNPMHTACAFISHTKEITKEEYLTLKKYL